MNFYLKNVALVLLCMMSMQSLSAQETPAKEKILKEESSTEKRVSMEAIPIQEMPRFPGCEEIEDQDEKKKCANEKLIRFVYGNLKYPSEARKNNTQGTVVIRFKVGTDGSPMDFELLRDIGFGCGEEAMRVLKSMPTWIPGKSDGEPVKVSFNMPVKFKL